MLQKEIKDWTFWSLYTNWETQFLTPADLIIENDFLLDPMRGSRIFVNGRQFGLFSAA